MRFLLRRIRLILGLSRRATVLGCRNDVCNEPEQALGFVLTGFPLALYTRRNGFLFVVPAYHKRQPLVAFLSRVYGETKMAVRNNFYRYFSAVILSCFCLVTTATAVTAQAPQQNDQKRFETLAVVNGQQITRHKIAEECMRRFGEDVLEDMLNKYLVLDACQKNGIVITEQDVNNEIATTAAKFGWSTERYIQTITSNKKITVDQMKNDHVWHMLAIRRLAAKKIEVTQAEVDAQMEAKYGEKVQVRQIVVKTEQEARQIHAQATSNPENFERLAKKFSIDQNTNAMGGLLLPVARNSGRPEFEDLCFSLQPGQISNIFPVADVFLVLRCERYFKAEQISPDQLPLIRSTMEEDIERGKLRTAAIDLFKQMQATANIVNVMNDPKLSQQMPGVAARINGINILKKDVGEECITRYGSSLLESEINRLVLLQQLETNGLQVGPEDINQEIARAAEAIGHLKKDGTVNIDEWLAYVTSNDMSKVDFYIEDEVWPTVALKKLVASGVKVEETDMQKGFEANFGPRVEVLAIVSNEHRAALKVWNMASANPTSDHFGKLANQYSIEPVSKNNFGQVIPIRKNGGQPELEKEAFNLKQGEISKVIQVGKHWITLYCLGRTEPVVTNFDSVKEEIYKDILEKKMRMAMGTEFRRLREEAQVDNFLSGTSQPGKSAVRSARSSNKAGKVPFGGQQR